MDKNARHRKRYAEMPEHEKADLLRHRRDANAAKKKRLSVPDIGHENGSPPNEEESSRHIGQTCLGCVIPSGPSRHGDGRDYG